MRTQNTESIQCSVQDGVWHLCIARPEKRNALTMPMFATIAEALKAKGVRVEAVEVVQHPQNTVALPPEEAQKVMRLVEALEDLDDVQHVYTNLDPESLQVEA